MNEVQNCCFEYFFAAIEIVPQVGEQFEIGESKKDVVQK